MTKKHQIIISITAVFVLIASVFVFIRQTNSNDELKWILRIHELPSVEVLQEGHDHWTDIVCCYYIKLKRTGDISAITQGREYTVHIFDKPRIEKTIHITPSISILAAKEYLVPNLSDNLKIFASEDDSEVIIQFSRD